MLKTTCRVLEKHGVNYRVVFGTLLGLYRDGRIIPHDTDLDLAIPDNSLSGVPSAVEELVNVEEFQMVRCGGNIISLGWENVYIDFYLFRHRKHFHLFKSPFLECECWSLDSGDFSCENVVKIDDVELKTIEHPEHFFRTYYGKDWKTPIKGLHAHPSNQSR